MQIHAAPTRIRSAKMVALLALLWAASILTWPRPAGQPVARPSGVRIDHIELAPQFVTVHFDTEPNRAYTLQAASRLPATDWTNLYTARAFPFANHYIVADDHRGQTSRVYRLLVVP